MKRNKFLKLITLGAIAIPVAAPVVIQALKAIPPTPPPLTAQGIMAQIEAMSNGPKEYTVWTGREGMKLFEEAMKELNNKL